ncbi:GatB/YqeY domain-containing protein [Singulisphaera sp. PoT]|uniref:GatB/YqeY domain-containing protein n=1 Tax=Singulisphaera sp. PoT TaxID=3411797 RepID=UPI003BF60206
MSIVQKMRAKLTESMKAKDAVRTQFLRYWIAGLTKGDGTELSETESIGKMRGVLKEAKSGSTTFTAEEIALLEEWVPATLTAEQVVAELASVADAIKAAPKDGMAMGVAMKALAGKPVDSQDVKTAVASIRGTA